MPNKETAAFYVRVTYWIAPGRRIILLTVFRKQRMREDNPWPRGRGGGAGE